MTRGAITDLDPSDLTNWTGESRLSFSGTALALILLAVSGNPVVSGTSTAPVILAAILSFVIFTRSGNLSVRFLRRYALLATTFGLVFAAHQWQFGVISVAGSSYFLVKMFVGGLVISSLGKTFGPHYFRAVYLLCVSSLFIYAILLLIGPEIFPTLVDEDLIGLNRKSIGVFTALTTADWWRNSSMFWEPGAFQGMINLAFLLMPAQLLLEKRIRWRLVAMVGALFTTFSTTGYLVFFALSAYKLYQLRARVTLRFFLIALVLGIGAVLISEAHFLGAKIRIQFENLSLSSDYSSDRFGALAFDLYYIEKHPVFGNGLIDETRFADHPYLHGLTRGHGNGLSNFTATYGLFGLLAYLSAITFARFAPLPSHRLFGAAVIAILLFSEQFLNYPLFLGLPFLALKEGRRLLSPRDEKSF